MELAASMYNSLVDELSAAPTASQKTLFIARFNQSRIAFVRGNYSKCIEMSKKCISIVSELMSQEYV